LFRSAALALLLAAGAARAGTPAAITIDYPQDGSVFPPEITPPTFLWRDSASAATLWRIRISFADGSPAIHTTSRGPRLRIGRIDPDCVSETNKLPTLTPEQAAAHTWTPDPLLWRSIKSRSVAAVASVTITGLHGGHALSRGWVTIRTSRDPVGAPIFYRDVPLMPTETQKGVIQPLAADAVRLIEWRLRDIAEPRSRVVMENVPMCANCHSFSADGKTLGMDMDGLQNNRGLYTLTPVAPETSIRNENVIQWRTSRRELKGNLRAGFMSQVSPDGQYVATTLNPVDLTPPSPQPPPSNYYVANFTDYRFLQVFYPMRGILCWYSRKTGLLKPLPGADNPRFVQTGAVWSPDGRYLVFARAEAQDPNPEGTPLARFANDPEERQIKYDLYRIPFNGGKGGVPEIIAGASRNGMSNTFPKVSPDGRWIVFVQCRNGLLMRPDSQLYIVPASGGQARRMRCNTRLMNSWHSFSPNGRWLVFSSKSRSPYTQMYLTHIGPDGNDSPAILVGNTTAANRAVNIPEFVNIPPDGLREIGGPVIQFYRLYDRAMYLQRRKRFGEAAAAWRKALEIEPDNVLANGNLAASLFAAGSRREAVAQFRKTRELKLRQALAANPEDARTRDALGLFLLETGRQDEAIEQLRKATELQPALAPARTDLGRALAAKGEMEEALGELRHALDIDPGYAPAHYGLGLVLARRGRTDDAIRQWREALALDPEYGEARRSLGDALYAQGQPAEALAQWRQSLDLDPNNPAMLRQTAWLLATSPDPSLRNGREALALAVRAMQLSGGRDPAVLDTLAAAYAETGRFADAVLTGRRALALASKENQPALVEAIEGRVAAYRTNRPFRQPR
jgi:tetratricopeptide (TPR) repeat protein